MSHYKTLLLVLFATFSCNAEDVFVLPKVIKIPEYPKLAAAAMDSGEVVVGYKIDAKGNVIDVEFKSGSKRLFVFARFGLSDWKFMQCKSSPMSLGELEMKFVFEIVTEKENAGGEFIYPDKVVIRGRPIRLRND